MPARIELKIRAKAQIKGNIGILFLCYLILGLISGTFIGALFAPALTLGMIMIYFGLINGVKPGVGDMFQGANFFGKALWLAVITYIFTCLWTILLVVPGIIKAISYSLAPYILADNTELTAREALSASKELTKGHKGELFVLELSFIPWFLLVGVTCGIAAIYVGPYVQATIANYYKELIKLPKAEE
jgi:uncharacterized membrane protein